VGVGPAGQVPGNDVDDSAEDDAADQRRQDEQAFELSAPGAEGSERFASEPATHQGTDHREDELVADTRLADELRDCAEQHRADDEQKGGEAAHSDVPANELKHGDHLRSSFFDLHPASRGRVRRSSAIRRPAA
jgi:hypothetical protein